MWLWEPKKLINLLILLIWIVFGTSLRLINLDLKPASSIEIATIGYSLGHGFLAIALDSPLSLDTLLAPLRLDNVLGYSDVFERLVTESTHPPLYFWLTRWWIDLWANNGDLATLQIARSLSAVFGILTIPAIFNLGWVSFRNPLTAHLAAIFMAISPYGIYLAQEARHYTLTILWVIISLTCLIKSLQLIQQKISLPLWLICSWIVVNSLGIATHYFFLLSCCAQAIAIIVFYLVKGREIGFKYWRGICLLVLGTLASFVAWLPIVTKISDNELTSWIATNYQLPNIFLPLARLVGWAIAMVMLLPLENVSTAIAILSALIMTIVVAWSIPKLIRGWYARLVNQDDNTLIFSTYLAGTIVLFLVLIYGLGKDISLAARYHFVYFPILLLLLASSLNDLWRSPTSGKRVVILLLIMGLISSLSVINNYGFQKSRYSNRLAAFIQNNSSNPAIVAMRYNTNSEIRELISIAYAFEGIARNSSAAPPQFLLNRLMVDGKDMGLFNIDRALDNQPRPLDFWAINLAVGEVDMNRIQCYKNQTLDLDSIQSGYRNRLYRCEQRQSDASP